MTDSRKVLTEETPENEEDLEQRGLTEVDGELQASAGPRRVLHERLLQDDDDEEITDTI